MPPNMHSDLEKPIVGYRARIRFHQNVFVKAPDNSVSFRVDGYSVTVSGPAAEGPLESQELMLNARGLPSEEAALEMGERLRRALIVKSAVRRTGLNLGEDQPISRLANSIKKKLKETHGVSIRDNVLGLDVFHDDGATAYFGFSAKGSSSTSAGTFFPQLAGSVTWADSINDRVLQAARILNVADEAAPPIVRLALSIAALESLTPSLGWSPDAMALLNGLLAQIEADETIEVEEREQIANSIRPVRDFGRSGARKVKSLLERHGLGGHYSAHAKAARVRAKLLHGNHVPASVQSAAAEDARIIASAVLDAELEACGINPSALRAAAPGAAADDAALIMLQNPSPDAG
jgi:hypothetical protein